MHGTTHSFYVFFSQQLCNKLPEAKPWFPEDHLQMLGFPHLCWQGIMKNNTNGTILGEIVGKTGGCWKVSEHQASYWWQSTKYKPRLLGIKIEGLNYYCWVLVIMVIGGYWGLLWDICCLANVTSQATDMKQCFTKILLPLFVGLVSPQSLVRSLSLRPRQTYLAGYWAPPCMGLKQ